MPELDNEVREIYLEPGELHIAREPAIINCSAAKHLHVHFPARDEKTRAEGVVDE
jgi:hypothetical protein